MSAVDPPADPVAPIQHEAVSAAPAAATCHLAGLPSQSAAHNLFLANPSKVVDIPKEEGSTASLIPTSGATPVPHPSSALAPASTSTPAVGTSWVPADNPTTHIPDAPKQAGKAAQAAPITADPTPISTPAIGATQAPTPPEVSAWPSLHDTLIPALHHNPNPATAQPDEGVSLVGSVVASQSFGQNTPALSAVAAASKATHLLASCKRPARPVKISLAEFHDQLGAPIAQQIGSNTRPVAQYKLSKRCVPQPEPLPHNKETILHEQAAPASTGLQSDRSASCFACVAVAAEHTALIVDRDYVILSPRQQVRGCC